MICRYLFFIISALVLQSTKAQVLSANERATFVTEQNAYLEDLNLSFDQRRYYEEISRKYDKLIIQFNRTGVGKMKTIKKAKNEEMKTILSDKQYKKYLKRQREIDAFFDSL